jgi:hypothetical protein
MRTFCSFCSRFSVRSVTYVWYSSGGCASHSEAATGIGAGKEATR